LLTINMVFSDKDKILIKTHKCSQSDLQQGWPVIRIEELKWVHLKCNLLALSFNICWMSAEIWIS